MTRIYTLSAGLLLALFFTGCAVQERSQTVAPLNVDANYTGPKQSIIVGSFNNNSTYMKGVFSDNVDRLGMQAKTVLKTHLQQTNRFDLLDRDNLKTLKDEAAYSKIKQDIDGAKYAIVGYVTEFGRRDSGDQQFFGILGSGKTQLAYAKVMLNVVDVHTTKVVHSSQGAGEYTLSSRQAVGFGSKSGYDSTLNGKVLDLAIREAINNLVADYTPGSWK